MSNEFYNDLTASLTQAVEIAQGRKQPSRKHSYDVSSVKALRCKTGLTQLQFAQRLNISNRTLQNWEQGTRRPTGATIALFKLLEKNPTLINELA